MGHLRIFAPCTFTRYRRTYHWGLQNRPITDWDTGKRASKKWSLQKVSETPLGIQRLVLGENPIWIIDAVNAQIP